MSLDNGRQVAFWKAVCGRAQGSLYPRSQPGLNILPRGHRSEQAIANMSRAHHCNAGAHSTPARPSATSKTGRPPAGVASSRRTSVQPRVGLSANNQRTPQIAVAEVDQGSATASSSVIVRASLGRSRLQLKIRPWLSSPPSWLPARPEAMIGRVPRGHDCRTQPRQACAHSRIVVNG